MQEKHNMLYPPKQVAFEQLSRIFFQQGEVTEIRALGLTGKSPHWEGWTKDTVSGYFDDPVLFAKAVKDLDGLKQATGIYFVLNPCDPALLARANNRLIAAKNATTDEQVVCHRWLLIDIDSQTPAGISATNKEVELAKDRLNEIISFLTEKGWPEPVFCFSGNGWHGLYRLQDLPNDQKTTELKKLALQSLNHKFGDKAIVVDLKVFNPARITKLYGTWARKGDSTQDRPHRQSFIEHIPEPIQPVTLKQLEWLASLAPKETPAPVQPRIQPSNEVDNSLGRMDVQAYLSHYGIEIVKTKQQAGATLYCLKHCVFDPEHVNNEASIVQANDGKLLYQCFHNSCQGRMWREARQVISADDSLAQFCYGYTTNRLNTYKPALEKEVKAIIGLDRLQREVERNRIAKVYGVRKKIIDEYIKEITNKEKAGGTPDVVTEVEAFDEEVDGNMLLNSISEELSKYVILPEGSAAAITAWTVLSFCSDAFRILPNLGITSPVKRYGKTTLLEVLQGLTAKGLTASNISPAAVFRTIDKYHPTLLIDEADTFLKDNDELRGVLNSGHTRTTAFVVRVEGDTHEPVKFSTWGPKVIAMIGQLPETLHDRSVVVELRRKMPGESAFKLDIDFESECEDIRRKCQRWADDNLDELTITRPEMPKTNNDRMTDNWMPLFAIAQIVGGEWPGLIKKSMLGMMGVEDDNVGSMLLEDIQDILLNSMERIFSDDLVAALKAKTERPWTDWNKGRGLNQNGLARLLKPFGIKSKNMRINENLRKGYELEGFRDVFKRYIPHVPPIPPISSVTASQINNINVLDEKQSVTDNNSVTDEKQDNLLNLKACYDVTDEKGGSEEDIKETELQSTETETEFDEGFI